MITDQNVGEKNGNAKLKAREVYEIRALCAEGQLPRQKIADRYGISKIAVTLVHLRRTWKHLPEA